MTTLRNENTPSSLSTRTPPEDRNAEREHSAVTGPIESMIRQIGIDKVYGTPITEGDTTVVPVAELRTGFGFGSGSDLEEGGEGGGGGAGLRMTPRGYLEITSEGVHYRPIYNVNALLAGGAFIGWLLYRLFSR